MRYQGGKFFQRKKNKDAIMKDLKNRETSGTYIEPFIGGGSMAAVMGNEFDYAQYSDTHPDLILMWKAFQEGVFTKDNIPHPTEQEYKDLRHAEPSAYRGLIGFACSFGAGWFNGFICKDKNHQQREGCSLDKSINRITEDITYMSAQKLTTFECKDYEETNIHTGDVIYCDPPYADTHGYSVGGFDSEKFWSTTKEWAKEGAYVYISEYKAPKGFTTVCEQSKNVTFADYKHRKVTTDRLYRAHK